MKRTDLIKSYLHTNMPIRVVEAVRAEIDAMQSALDDAERKRSTWMGRWLSVACERDELRAKLAARDAEVATLHRWKSTNAPRLEVLQGLLETAQKAAHAGFEAVATLASERKANSILTAEVERLQNMLFAAGAMEEAPCFCCGYNGPGYFQPEKHSCASRHHTLSEEVKGGV